MDALSGHEVEVLTFAALPWRSAGAKQQAVKDVFDLSLVRYEQELNALLDRPEALAHDPVLVNRLRRLRDQHRRERSARRLLERQ